ncbi:MAG: hypothetical protein HRF50_00540 [Phycisphaerae bacterium]
MRRAIGLVLAVIQFWGTVGVYPGYVQRAPTSLDFPCAGHACGCVSAEQCFSACCCFAPAVRLAWAREHAAPTALIALIAQADPVSRDGSCCEARHRDAVPAASLVARVARARPGESAPPPFAAPAFRSLNCRGAASWLAGACVLSAPPPSLAAIEFIPPVEPIGACSVRCPDARALDPLDPPPRFAPAGTC